MSNDERARKVVLVTGASEGIGRQIALTLAARGYRVFAGIRASRGRNATRVAELERLAAAGGVTLEIADMDVTDEASVVAAVRAIVEQAGRIDGLVNNAGFGVIGPWESTTVDDVKRQFDTNTFGVFRVSKAVAPTMRAQGSGTIVTISSDAAMRVGLFESVYAASKFAVEGLSQGMRWELRQFGIKVCVVNPGWFTTNFPNSMIANSDLLQPGGPYQPLVEHLREVRPRKESPRDDLEVVADRVAALLEMDDPPFRNPVAASPLRAAQLTDEEFERRLFDFYEMEAFRGTGA
jgi:NAD(P)-dependent dehydrogenase (short-subunit alcohol dehydrogenase family)